MKKKFERKADGRFFLSIAATGILSFVGVVIETAMNVTFPTLMQEFSVTTDTVQWLTTGYLLVLACIIPVSGFLKRRFPMKRLFVCAAALFIIGTILDGQATSITAMIIGRMLQGGGTGVALPLMFNIVIEQAPQDKMGLMMGAAMLVCALAPAVGPSVGGFIVTHFGWRMIFWCLLPVLVLSLCAGAYAIRQSSDYGKTPFDFLGWLCLAFSFTCFILACTRLDKLAAQAVPIAGLLVLTLLGLYAFYQHEEKRKKTGKAALINLDVFTRPSFVFSVFGVVGMQFVVLAIGFLIPNFSQLVSGETAFRAGCILLPGCLVGAALAPISGRIYDWLGARRPILTGSILALVSVILFNLLLPSASTLVLTCIYVIYTIGQGLSVGNILTFGLSQLPMPLRSDGNAVFNTLQQLAGAIGTAAAAAIVAAAQHGAADFTLATADGTKTAFVMLLLISAAQGLCMVCAFRHQQ